MAADDVIPNMYYISTYGRVYSFGKRRKFLKPVKTDNGYYRINLRRMHGAPRYTLLHRLVLITFYSVSGYQSLQVNHIDCDKSNNMVTNLFWCTRKENINHAIQNNLINNVGENNPQSIISDEQAN